MVTRILIPTDGSKTAAKAARFAVDLAKRLKSGVTILSVVDQRPYFPPAMPAAAASLRIPEPIDDYLREAAETAAAEVKAVCSKAGVRSKVVLKTGHPVEEIIKEAVKAKADLIVMGSHGHSALAAAVLGSVTYGVIHKDSKVPVLVVRR